MRRIAMEAIGAIALFGLGAVVAHSKPGQTMMAKFDHGSKAPAPPTDKTAFWTAEELDARWKEDEAMKQNNSRLFNGPKDETVNIRIATEGAPPLVHPETSDLWIVTAGTAVAVTDGEVVGPLKETNTPGDIAAKELKNPTERNVKVGDMLYVPPKVGHYFKNLNGFRAFLIRFNP